MDVSKSALEVLFKRIRNYLHKSQKHKGDFTSSQKQAVIKLKEKKDKDETFIKNWFLISLLNVDYKIVSKALVVPLEKVLSFFNDTGEHIICSK